MLCFDSGCTENREHLLLFVQSRSQSLRVVIPKQYATSTLVLSWILDFGLFLFSRREIGKRVVHYQKKGILFAHSDHKPRQIIGFLPKWRTNESKMLCLWKKWTLKTLSYAEKHTIVCLHLFADFAKYSLCLSISQDDECLCLSTITITKKNGSPNTAIHLELEELECYPRSSSTIGEISTL